MKLLLSIVLVFIVFFNKNAEAQNDLGKSDDTDRIAVDVFVPRNVEEIPDQAQSLLESRLMQAATQSGLGGEGIASRFVLTAKIEVISKDVTPTAPVMQAFNFDIYLYIVDNIERIVLSSTSFSSKGVGTSKNKAYTNALQKINLNNQEIKQFLSAGKQKIISYYNSKCDVIIARANALSSQNQFQNAIYSLSSVPEVCRDCYLKSLEAIGPIFQKYIDHECATYLNRAEALFAANPNSVGAMEAAELISLIDPNSKCFEDAGYLISKIEEKMRSDENRGWNFKEQMWNDKIDIERIRIKAYRDVGVAYGENQRSNYDVLWLFD